MPQRVLVNLYCLLAVTMFAGCDPSVDNRRGASGAQERRMESDLSGLKQPLNGNEVVDEFSRDELDPGIAVEPAEVIVLVEETRRLSVKQLCNARSADKESFAEQHEGHWFEVTGFVYDLGVLWPGNLGSPQPYVVLCPMTDEVNRKELGELDFTKTLYCFMPGVYPWRQFGTGARVTLQGKYHYVGYLEGCRIIEQDGEPLSSLTATELVNEYMSDFDVAQRKYGFGMKSVVVSGSVKRIEHAGIDSFATFQAGDYEIILYYTALGQFKDVAPGQEITVIAQCLPQGGEVDVPVCLNACQRCDLVESP